METKYPETSKKNETLRMKEESKIHISYQTMLH